MSKGLKLILSCLIGLFELYFVLFMNVYLHGAVFDVSYRREPRVAAYWEYHQHPSPATKATFDIEKAKLDSYLGWKFLLQFITLLIVNWVGFRWFWKFSLNPKTINSYFDEPARYLSSPNEGKK